MQESTPLKCQFEAPMLYIDRQGMFLLVQHVARGSKNQLN